MSRSETELNERGWGVRRIHHVAFAHQGPEVLDRLESVLGLRCHEPEPAEGFVERMFPIGDAYLQTLEATGPGDVGRFVDRRGPALHHVAFEVEDLDTALAELRRRGTRMVDESPRPGGAGTRIAFLHPSACGGLLVELVEPSREAPSW
ncbi:MAG TPA: VOC family protein [Acidimicrobiales bacterium]|nr:VOC family protein [Acidimicrobiales bacterium]